MNTQNNRKNNQQNETINTSGSSAQPSEAIKTSRLATTALVLAIIGIALRILAIPGLILGIASLVIIKKNKEKLKGKGLAIAAIILPIVYIPLTMYTLLETRQIARRVLSGTNLAGLARAVELYSNDYGEIPTAKNWCDLLMTYADVTPKTLYYPGKDRVYGYALNENLKGCDLWSTPGDVVLLFEAQAGKNAIGGPEMLDVKMNNGKGVNIAFVDHHVEFVKTEDLAKLRWKP